MTIIQKIQGLIKRPVDRRFVFVVTYGRSGSTLLMNLINSCEGCCVRGENYNALHSIYQSYKKIVDAQREHGKNAHLTSSPWWGVSSVDADSYARRLVASFVDEVIMPGPKDFLCGFKEIRFSRREVPELREYLDFLTKFFPNSKIIFNHRNLDDVAASKWWSKMPNARSLLEDMDGRFNEIQGSSSVFHFYYDEAVKNREHVRDMFYFLDILYDELAVQGVFQSRHSY